MHRCIVRLVWLKMQQIIIDWCHSGSDIEMECGTLREALWHLRFIELRHLFDRFYRAKDHVQRFGVLSVVRSHQLFGGKLSQPRGSWKCHLVLLLRFILLREMHLSTLLVLLTLSKMYMLKWVEIQINSACPVELMPIHTYYSKGLLAVEKIFVVDFIIHLVASQLTSLLIHNGHLTA